MFCPKCGDELIEAEDGISCVRGEMILSPHLALRFKQCFIDRVDRPREARFSFPVGGRWFCPGCGVEMLEEDGHIRCPRCNCSLNEFIHQLVELHPHRRVNTAERGVAEAEA